jgi:hypothetical protein
MGIASGASPSECTFELQDDQGPDYLNMSNGCLGVPTPTGPGGADCTALAACCASVDNPNEYACGEVAVEGVEATCTYFLGTLRQNEHVCGG